jgi:antitoxin HicB
MARYPVTLTQDDNDTLLVEFPDFPEAHTFGEDEEEALARAVDALETIIDAYIRDKRNIPAPSAVTGASVTLPSLIDTKVQIYTAMRAQRVGKAELAKRLNVFLPQVDRLLDVRHGSKIDQLEAAAQALGSSLKVTLVPHEQYNAAALKRHTAVALKSSRKPAERHRSRVLPVHAGVLAAQKARRSGAGGSKKK